MMRRVKRGAAGALVFAAAFALSVDPRQRALAPLAALALVVGMAGCGGSAAPAGLASAQPTELQTLIAKMRRLRVSSERYTHVSHVVVRAGKRTRRYENALLGEVASSAGRGETFSNRAASMPLDLVVGSTLYTYSQMLGRCDGGRPWVRRSGRHEGAFVDGHEIKSGPSPVPANASSPYQAVRGERSRGGSGPYAGLINLLETASARVVGAATIDGERTTEFAASVDPAALLRGVSQDDLSPLARDNETTLLLQLNLPTPPYTAAAVPVRLGAPCARDQDGDVRELIRGQRAD
jgi:hypothetical protein